MYFKVDIVTMYDGYEWSYTFVTKASNEELARKGVYAQQNNYVHEDIGEEITGVYISQIPQKDYDVLKKYI